METLQLILIIIATLASLVSLILSLKNSGKSTDFDGIMQKQTREILRESRDNSSALRTELLKSTTDNTMTLAHHLKETLDSQFMSQRDSVQNSFKQQAELLNRALENIAVQLGQFEKRLGSFATENEQKLDNIRKTVDENLKSMREDNNKKLDEMRKTVDEKLQSELEKRVKSSFEQVQTLLERVQKDIGSMRTLAEDVGGLKRSLTNVKTRGMMGEFQLESILSDVFSQKQYEKNAHPNPDNPNAVVEFALKIPTEDDEFIYLPIDSKFPRDTYDAVIAASQSDSKAELDAAIKQYTIKLKLCAAEIKKYIAPPYTTDYAIMFLPTESMYADAINHGMLEELFRSYRVYVTGPSTITALLGSMQLSFSNMAIQKRATEVFGVLTDVKQEFSKFQDALSQMKKHLDATSKDLSNLMETRTNQLNRKLNRISSLALNEPESDTGTLLPGTGESSEDA